MIPFTAGGVERSTQKHTTSYFSPLFIAGAKRTAEESQQSGESPSNKKQRGDGDDEHYGPGEGPEITLRFLIQSQVGLDLSFVMFILTPSPSLDQKSWV